MKKHQTRHHRYLCNLIFIFSLMGTISCVSVDLKPKAPTKSEVYEYSEPKNPFEEMISDHADHAWQNQKTGNTIAVLSECSESRDPSLASIEGETINALTNPQKIKTNEIQFSSRGGLRTVVEGQVDGVTVKMDVLTFKKNSCSYTLSYIGRSKGFEKDQSAFEEFLKGFKVP